MEQGLELSIPGGSKNFDLCSCSLTNSTAGIVRRSVIFDIIRTIKLIFPFTTGRSWISDRPILKGKSTLIVRMMSKITDLLITIPCTLKIKRLSVFNFH
jgi:hypothetical protein